MNNNNIKQVLKILSLEKKKWKVPIVGKIQDEFKDPFPVLISCILSLRTRDSVTARASKNLFALANTPKKMQMLSPEKIRKTIYPVGFYRKKAKTIKTISKIIMNEYDGLVPDEIDELLKLPGVGRKTANLVVTVAYNKSGICVDTHVHRITNRWGYVNTRSPFETEMMLRRKLPKNYWISFNDLLVTFGQNQCKPVSPNCRICKISKYCEFYKKNLDKSNDFLYK